MCGIAGMFLKHEAADGARLRAAAAALAHRGPDGQGMFLEGGVGMAHTRLSIIDLAHGGQPLYSHDDQLVLVANGEIYNYVELRRQLEGAGHVFATHSDCETALYAYRQWGEGFVDALYGMFALALYDRSKEQLLLVRDRLGIKPLFIQSDAQGVYFGSELKALFALRAQRPQIDPTGLVQYLQNNFTSRATTLVAGIERVLPGEAVLIGRAGIIKRWQYWTPNEIAPFSGSEAEAMEQFEQLMREVMRIHLRSDVPIGLFLSGGVDSAALLALLHQQCDAPVRTYSVGFPDSSVANELAAAERIAKQFNARHTVLELDQAALLHALPYSVWAADDLMGDYANLPVALLAQRAARDLKVVFSGEGGDEVFAGYARYRAPRLKRWLKQLAWPGSGGFRMSKTIASRWERRLYGAVLHAHQDSWAEPFIACWQGLPKSMPALARMQAVDIQTWLADDLLVKADRMLMAWGVEGRVPFLDHRIVEFGLSLPAAMKIEGKTGKMFLRRWAQRHLPMDHVWGKKRGFTVPVADWLKGPLLDELERSLLRSAGVQEWFEPQGLRALCARQREYHDQTQPLWRLWQFAIWHRLFIAGAGAEPAAQADPIAILAD
ncbi:MAG: asparagine synthase (glutamine-hydrolyzing) [Pseudomonadota bacterium]